MAIDNDELHFIALEYINTPGLTMLALAEKHGYSKATVVRALSGQFREKLSPEMQKKVDDVKAERWIAGKSTYGHKGHKKISDAEMTDLAKQMVEDGSTLENLREVAGVSKTTLYNSFTPDILGDDLHALVTEQYGKNKRTRCGRK